MEVAPGAVHLERCLTLDRQRVLVNACRALIDGDPPAYVPVVRGGGKMHVRMLCLGRHWSAQSYRYEATRSDFDNRAAPPLPDELRAVATAAAEAAGMPIVPDLCI